VLYDYSKQIIQTYDGLHTKLSELKEIISGTIRLATIYSIGLHDLPPYLKRFLKAHPTVNVHVEYRRANQVYEDVVGNVVDLGLVAYPVRDAKIEIVPLRKDPLVLVCHPQHPFAKSKSIRLKALNGQKFIGFEPDIPTRKALDKILKEHSVQVQHVMEFDNIETVKRAVEIDAGIAVVPQGTVVSEIAKQTLVQVTFDDGEFYRPLAAIHKKTKVLSLAMKEFLATIKGDK
jgi:DNA-binding transcriptional LysR family regulator